MGSDLIEIEHEDEFGSLVTFLSERYSADLEKTFWLAGNDIG